MSRTRRNHENKYLWLDEEERGRDRKPRNKPPKGFKQMRRRQERARAKQAIREGYDPDPIRHGDQWKWT